MKLMGKLFLRTSVCLVALIGALTLGVTAFTYSGSVNRETARSLARVFFVQMWKGSQNRSATTIVLPSATPEGRTIE
jgi:hypothetical protein